MSEREASGERSAEEGAEALKHLAERARRAAGIPARVTAGRVELVPTSLREVARAQAARALLGADALEVCLTAFDRVEPPEPKSCVVRVGGSARVEDVEGALKGWALTLGPLTPRARGLTVRQWLTGPRAGLRPVPGNRLETAALSVSVALVGGGIYQSHPSPRSAVGPMLDALFLGAGEQAGLLVEATLRAMPRPGALECVRAFLERAEDVAALLRRAVQAGIPLAQVQVGRKARGYAMDLAIASPTFRARRDRAALEGMAAAKGELKTMGHIDDRELPFEGELAWDRLAVAVAQSGLLGLYRLARESVVVAAPEPIEGALPLDAPPPPLPEALLRALGARARASAEEPS